MRSLTEIDLYNCGLTKAGAQALRKARPLLRILDISFPDPYLPGESDAEYWKRMNEKKERAVKDAKRRAREEADAKKRAKGGK